MFNEHLRSAVDSFPSLFRYLILLSVLAVPLFYVVRMYIGFSHEVVTMALTNTSEPWPLRLFIAVLVCGMPAMLFRPRIARSLIRAVVSLARQPRNDRDANPGA